jgi:hypothetical protein
LNRLLSQDLIIKNFYLFSSLLIWLQRGIQFCLFQENDLKKVAPIPYKFWWSILTNIIAVLPQKLSWDYIDVWTDFLQMNLWTR